MILIPGRHPAAAFEADAGRKASQLEKLVRLGIEVPPFACIPDSALEQFLGQSRIPDPSQAGDPDIEAFFAAIPLPASLREALHKLLESPPFSESFLAVRSSGLEEDGARHSFAGQFSSFLFQKGFAAVEASIKRCWASAYSARATAYRRSLGLAASGSPARVRMGVILQQMVDCEVAGVAFSRNPVRPLDRASLVVSSLWGQGEGLVGGTLDADHFQIDRTSLSVTLRKIESKSHALVQSAQGGLKKLAIEANRATAPSLTEPQLREVASLALRLEKLLGGPQDCEWGIASGKLHCLQSRPITSLPPDVFFDQSINGGAPALWDNSNIIESYSGVTSPLTFSFASSAYRQVYVQFCEIMGVPRSLIEARDPMFRNMLGLIRGRIYYNLVNWYRLVLMLPGASNNKAFMETMMGVRQKLRPELAKVLEFSDRPESYSFASRMRLLWSTLRRWRAIDAIIGDFQAHFDSIYERARRTDFRSLSLQEHLALYHRYDAELLRRWQAPIINDYLCMVFFGLLKRLTEKWLGGDAASLQNDLLCGQGDLQSTEPTKMLMRIASWIDTDPQARSLREWWLASPCEAILHELRSPETRHFEAARRLREFLDRYGFRCINELKLEANDLHDDPSFAIEAISAYIRRKSYSITEMEEREQSIRKKAEAEARNRLGGWKRAVYFWVLGEARKAVRNRENLRFDRTKIFGVIRHLFRGMGHRLQLLGQIEAERDVFMLTADELVAWIEGRSPTLELKEIVRLRKREFAEYEATPPPPDRFATLGSVGFSQRFEQVLMDGDLLRAEESEGGDPSLLRGTPCCPGIIEGVVRVVRDAADARGLDGEILVTERTDPGWVPLYPSCSGLLIERGSLLSHSAVVARELGLPTIVGVSGGLLRRLRTGMRVRVDAGKGEIRILS